MPTTAPALTGVIGHRWRAEVTSSGGVVPLDGSPRLDWYVAAEDRWHTPADEIAVRQQRTAGTPVFETRVRVPDGDVVQRIWSIAHSGGLTLLEFTNESSRAVAVALTRGDVLTARPPAVVPIEGIDLPPGSIVVPIAHGTSALVGIRHVGRGPGLLPPGLPGIDKTVNGWLVLAATASRLELPDESLSTAVIGERSDVLLAGPPSLKDDPVGTVLAIVELVRMGDPAPPWVPDLAHAVEACASLSGWDADAASERAAIVLARADERRAQRDLERVLARRRAALPAVADPSEPPAGIRLVAWTERLLCRSGKLLASGLPASWRGQHFEVFDVPTGPGGTVSYAVRWHGERPAVLWEQQGDRVTLTAPAVDPSWSSDAERGEALWQAPERLPA